MTSAVGGGGGGATPLPPTSNAISFVVPAPVPARDGQTLCRAQRGWQALFPRLPGSRPDYRDPAQVEAVGAALGELHAALAPYPREAKPGHSAFGDLHLIHPRVPDPYALPPDRLGLPATPPDDALLAWWRSELAALRPFIDGPYRALPRQVIHSDFMLGNVLIHAGRISGVLDFEFALPDARAIDVASGLEYTMRVWENPAPFETARAFCRGYARWGRLTAAEIDALPWLMRLRDAASAVWWLGRALDAGDARPGLERIAHLRTFTRWLGRHAGRLASVVRLEVGEAG